ncbi:MAG TPA: Tex family protein [Planctomycetaceae bacterium]|nr:Tex family protein [Planctomycetaceae bacterium]
MTQGTDQPVAVEFDQLAAELGHSPAQVAGVVDLLDGGNTVPFITRYRKERTGNLDEEQIRRIEQRVQALRLVAERRQAILRLIDGQGRLTPELRAAIAAADSLKRLEDLYLPFRPKRQSRATAARERGLEPLAEAIWSGDASIGELEAAAADSVNPDSGVPGPAEALAGAADILAERISEDADVRQLARRIAWKSGRLVVRPTTDGEQSGQAYRDYFNYAEAVSRIPPHRVLALNRGEKADALRVKFEWDDEQVRAAVARHYGFERRRFAAFLSACADDALARLVQPSLDREVRRELTEQAEAHAVGVFARNLKNLLLQPPLRDARVLAIDPGFRTGAKIAVLDELGNCVATDLVYVTGSTDKRTAARSRLAELMNAHACRLVAIGNGTACRETEELVSETIAVHAPEARYLIVNEAGASIYSASTVAREEFPQLDATDRGTISIGRRLQDPLSELVKIDPQHLGVGMYQHDVSPRRLKESLEAVVESCVNFVGVDLNTASASLLRHVAGLNQLIARRIVERRDQQGRFASRQQLLEIPGVGPATFTQAAGFLRIAAGDEPLDATSIHPESYEAARRILQRLGVEPQVLGTESPQFAALRRQLSEFDAAAVAGELGIGELTCRDILDALARPGRDPRADRPGPAFRRGVLKLDDLSDGLELTGTVLNVVDFGAFVDIGLKDSGLVHISQMAARYVESPHDVLAVGDSITVWVLSVDKERRRVSLTMVPPGTPRETGARPGAAKGTSRAGSPRGGGGPETDDTAAPKPAASTTAPAAAPAPAASGTGAADRSNGAAGRGAAENGAQTKPRRRKDRRRDQPAPPLSSEMLAGREPLRGFDELKELWKNRS